MLRQLISAAACVAAVLCAPAAFAAPGSAVTELDIASMTSSLQNASASFGGWTFRSRSDADNGGSFSQTVSPSAFSDADVPGVSALTSPGHAHANSTGGTGIATMEMLGEFSLAAGSHLSFYVPYSITVHTAQLSDNNRGNVFFEIKNTANNGVVYNQDVSFGSGGLHYQLAGGTDSQSGNILVDFYNGTGSAANYSFFGHINATAEAAFAPAVPEPATYAMLLSGMALLGVMARRRNRG